MSSTASISKEWTPTLRLTTLNDRDLSVSEARCGVWGAKGRVLRGLQCL